MGSNPGGGMMIIKDNDRIEWKYSGEVHSLPLTVGSFGTTYKNILQDEYGWVKVEHFYPILYDLCEIKMEEGIYKGWWTGSGWDGRWCLREKTPLEWRKLKEGDLKNAF